MKLFRLRLPCPNHLTQANTIVLFFNQESLSAHWQASSWIPKTRSLTRYMIKVSSTIIIQCSVNDFTISESRTPELQLFSLLSSIIVLCHGIMISSGFNSSYVSLTRLEEPTVTGFEYGPGVGNDATQTTGTGMPRRLTGRLEAESSKPDSESLKFSAQDRSIQLEILKPLAKAQNHHVDSDALAFFGEFGNLICVACNHPSSFGDFGSDLRKCNQCKNMFPPVKDFFSNDRKHMPRYFCTCLNPLCTLFRNKFLCLDCLIPTSLRKFELNSRRDKGNVTAMLTALKVIAIAADYLAKDRRKMSVLDLSGYAAAFAISASFAFGSVVGIERDKGIFEEIVKSSVQEDLHQIVLLNVGVKQLGIFAGRLMYFITS